MLIQPDSSIRLIKNCHIDNSYKDTIYFDNPQEQYTYFRSLEGVNFEKQSYQRFDEGIITLQAPINNVYNSNYLMFKNTAFENKWFYAFVNRVEYVNNVTVRVYYEIDVIQSYMFDVRDYIHPCFIERNHTFTDAIGDNLIPESLNIGEYIEHETMSYGATEISDLSVVFEYKSLTSNADVFFIFGDDGVLYFPFPTGVEGETEIREVGGYFSYGVYGKTYCDTNYAWIELKDKNYAVVAEGFLDITDADTIGGVTNVFMMPTDVIKSYKKNNFNQKYTEILTVNRPTEYIDGHKVVNRKLFTFPYCCLNIRGDTDTGKNLDFDLLDSYTIVDDNGNPVSDPIDNAILVNCPMTQGSNLIAYPAKYKNMEFPVEYGAQTSPFPMCRYNQDKFTEWVANESFSFMVKALGSVVGVFLGGASGGLTANQALEIFQEHPPKVTKPLSQHNYRQSTIDKHNINMAIRQGVLNELTHQDYSVGNSNANIANMISGSLSSLVSQNGATNGGGSAVFSSIMGGVIRISAMTIRNYAAKMIDDYFTMYGYAIQSIEQPQFNNRENFTYIKTNGFSVHGGAPSEVLSQIGNIHDSGITYWNKDSVIGDYSQSNRPLLEVDVNG